VHLNLAYRWFCRLGLEDKIPDHSTFSKNRHGRFRQSETFRHFFEAVLCRCMSEGLVGGEGFAVDASIIKADANRANVSTPDDPKDWTQGEASARAVRESWLHWKMQTQLGMSPRHQPRQSLRPESSRCQILHHVTRPPLVDPLSLPTSPTI
jgi:IS5 family transposase